MNKDRNKILQKSKIAGIQPANFSLHYRYSNFYIISSARLQRKVFITLIFLKIDSLCAQGYPFFEIMTKVQGLDICKIRTNYQII